ncbi:serine hydrolase domain-containing protein [Sphingomonas phyllosphaerae]|uniref:serine hydrolase domain-containing protein n=1 Tax=Sphingomonas phyllosphaerae TaxID=257003 RepID=UPI0003B72D3F|nr:serine hydrolase domain-containing protein [Sphingomonas phyllosphaerae]
MKREWLRRDLLKTVPALAFSTTSMGLRAAVPADPIAPLLASFLNDAKADGISVAIVRDGVTQYHDAGFAVRDGALASRDSVYEIGSITKTFTGLILAHAIQEKRVGLNDDIRRYLPSSFDNLAKDGRPITFADIVTTTSALPNNIPDWGGGLGNSTPAELPLRVTQFYQNYTPSDFLRDLAKVELIDTPARETRHSNTASELLGILLSRIYGQPYPTLVARYIEKPLGMRGGTGPIPPTRLAIGYDEKAMPALSLPIILPAGGLRYGTADMARYLQAQIAARDAAVARTQQPLWGTTDHQAIGFHWIIAKAADSQLYYRHSGGSFGCSSYCDFYPASRYGIVLLSNRGGGDVQYQLEQLAGVIRAALLGPFVGFASLERTLEASDYTDVPGSVAAARRQHPELHLNEDRLNEWGYRLLFAKRAPAAAAIFAYNATANPDSANAHDSYADALAAIEDKTRAIAEYERALKLNPGNDHSAEMLTKLRKGT